MLIRLLDHYFLATAKHNLYAGAEGVLIDGRTILLGSLGDKLFMFPVDGFYAGEDLDVAVALLNHDQVSRLIDRGFGLLIEPSIELAATARVFSGDNDGYLINGTQIGPGRIGKAPCRT